MTTNTAPGDKLFYGNGEYTSNGPSQTDKPGMHFDYGSDTGGMKTINIGGGDHYEQTGTVQPAHHIDWNRLGG